MRLKDKVAIITGSARGMGKEFCLRFAREGAKVIACDILGCESTVNGITDIGGDVLALKVDVSSERETAEMAKRAIEKYGRIDVLVNNAAVYGGIENKQFLEPFENISVQAWDKMMAVNLKGVFLCCKAVSPYMKKQCSGKIINISSTAALAGISLFMHYTTSKGGVIAMTKALARSLGDYNINVNAVAPGMVWTEASQAAFSADMANQIVSGFCIKKFIQPEHISGAVVFLASSDADQITGQTLAVNNGEFLQ